MSLNNDIFPESKGALINANFACNNESLSYVTLVSRYSKYFYTMNQNINDFVKSYFVMSQDTFCTNKVCEILWEGENMFVTIL